MDNQQAQNAIALQQKMIALRLLGTFLGGALVLNSFLAQYMFDMSDDTAGLSAFIGAVLLSIPILWSSLRSLFSGKLHMQELVALALLACFALQDYKTAGIVAFIMLGAELIQSRSALGARAAIEGLVRLTPTRARLVQSDGTTTEIEARSLSADSSIIVLPGEYIPADGVITAGNATINEASITGESMPVEKKGTDTVFAGTLNINGKITIKVTRAGDDTTLGKVKKLIMEAEQTKAPIMRIIDQYVSWYTPVIVMIAGIILYFTRDMSRAVTALVVTCPCALILATPTAMVAALSSAARLGILVKNVRHLELASRLNAIVFDKTGTLTTGELAVTKLSPLSKDANAGMDLLSLAGSLASNSMHPVSKAVSTMAKQARVPLHTVSDFAEEAGMGILGTVEKNRVIVGKIQWLKQHKITVKEPKDAPETAGLSLLHVAVNETYIGWIGLEDKTRGEAREAAIQLHSAGIKKIMMLTGDRESVAEKVAKELGCEEYRSQCLPEQKLQEVHALQDKGYIVAVVGDGINDAPALAAGDIGIAMGAAGSDIAIHSASISLMNNDLRRLPFIVALSKKTRTVIFQNMAFGIFFIAAGLTASGLGYLNPIIAAVLHNVGAFVVIFNSARLVRMGEHLNPHE
ncbi:MAG: cation-translocating P-type ATPase [Candidatus Auribacterota bacterium]